MLIFFFTTWIIKMPARSDEIRNTGLRRIFKVAYVSIKITKNINITILA